MQTKQLLFYVLILFQILIMKSVEAQWQIGTGSGNFGESDNNNIEAIGIGDFVNNSDEPQGALDIRIPYLYPSSLPYHPSEAFQTTTQEDYGAVWRMFTGRETWNRTEKFHIMNPDPSSPSPGYSLKDDIHLKALQDNEGGFMDFFTSNEHWMRLNPEPKNGYLGLNDFINTGYWYPLSNLHMNRANDAEEVFLQMTNGASGSTTNTQGFKVGIAQDNNLKTLAELRQYIDAPIVISSSTTTSDPNSLTERMRITYGTGGPSSLSNMTKVSISYGNSFNPIKDPVAMLNLGEGINAASLGNRTWMEVGTHMVRQSDQMYVGIKDEGSDFGNAVINWGDNPTNGDPYGPDMLKFIFTGSYSSGSSVAKNSYDGLEIARMTATGNMGIGTGWNNTNILPKRRLDIIDNSSSGGGGTNYPDHVSGPQLRLTHTANPSLTGGIFSDFETTSNGDLNIKPYNSATQRFFGVHKSSPITTLHVGGTAGTSGAITSDYLNHTATPSAPGSNPYFVYSDANGTLLNLPPAGNSSYILHGDGTWGPAGTGGGNVNSCSGTLTNYIPVFDASSNICSSDLYNTIGSRVGMNTITPAAAIHTLATGADASFISANSSGDYSIFANYDNRVSIGSNTTWNTGGGQGARLWVKGFTAAGSGSPLLGILATDANNRKYFETDDDGKVLLGSFFANNGSGPEGRMAINRGNVDNFVNLFVVTSHNSVSSNLERAFAASNSSYADLLTCWADEHVTMGVGGPPGGTSADARLVVAALDSGRAAFFGGDIYYNGAWQLSDSTLKKNIQPIHDALSVVKALVPKSFEFDPTNNPGMNLTDGHHYGFMAQEVERILPSLVQDHSSPGTYDTTGAAIIPSQDFKAMNYTEIIPLLTGAIQEQQSIIDSMKVRMDAIEASLLNCCPMQGQRIANPANNSIDIDLSYSNAIILNQNDPNPFSQETRITFNIPESVISADLVFYTTSGIILKSIPISTRGPGQVNVFASDLSSGIYMYALRADGNTIDTKKMICKK